MRGGRSWLLRRRRCAVLGSSGFLCLVGLQVWAELYVVRGGDKGSFVDCGIAQKAMQLPGRSLWVRIPTLAGILEELVCFVEQIPL